MRNLLNRTEESVRQSVLQLENVTIWMHRNAMLAVANSDAERAERVIERVDGLDEQIHCEYVFRRADFATDS